MQWRGLIGAIRPPAALLMLVAASVLVASAARAQTRVALIVGNNAYLNAPPLNNAVNDAVSISAELQKFGFQIIRVIDGKADEITDAKRRYLAAVANGGIGVFYFSGHGVQIEGRNYLLAVDSSAANTGDLARSAISVPNVLDEVDRARAKLSILILDACRDNPFAARNTVATRGLSEAARPIPSGTLILYAASSNQTALDGLPSQRSPNGLFSAEFLGALKEPNLEVRDLARKVRYSVMEKAQSIGHLQVPALYDNLSGGSFYFDPRDPRAIGPQARPAQSALPARIKIIIPFAEGGPSDAIVRAMGPLLGRALNREIAFENQIDVQGDRVAALLASSPKDGSVLLVSPYATAARRLAANDTRLSPLGIFVDAPLTLVVNASNGAKSLSELRAAVMRSGRQCRLGVPLRGSAAELCAQQFRRAFGAGLVEFASVNGEAPAMVEVMNGTADLTCANAGSVRAMAPAAKAKVRELAEVRSSASPFARRLAVESTGAQGFDVVAPNWLALFAPAGANSDAVRTISAAIATIQADQSYPDAIARNQALPVSAAQASPEGLIESLRLALALQRQ